MIYYFSINRLTVFISITDYFNHCDERARMFSEDFLSFFFPVEFLFLLCELPRDHLSSSLFLSRVAGRL